MVYLACRPGPTRVSQVPGVALPPYHALGGPRRTLGDLTGSGPLVSASGAFNPSPSALSLMTGLSHASGSAVFPAVCGIPCGRFNGVVRLWPPSPLQHSVGVAGWALLRRDLHPARNAKLRLAHERRKLTASRSTIGFGFLPIRHRAAMRWSAVLGVYGVYSSPKKRRLTVSSTLDSGPIP